MPAGMSRNAFIPVFVLAGPSLNYKNVFVCLHNGRPYHESHGNIRKYIRKYIGKYIGKYIRNKRVDGFTGACNTLCQCFEVSRKPYKHLKTVSQS